VAVSYIGVNFADCLLRVGLYAAARYYGSYPVVPGFDFSGHVTEVGQEVHDFNIGDKVFGVTRFGAYQTEVVVDSAALVLVPTHLDMATAASLPTAFLTAFQIVQNTSNLKAGEKFLVRSIAGGVGSWLAQLGLRVGAEVHGTVSTAQKKEELERKGFKNVHIGSNPPGNFDVIANAYGGETIRQDIARLRPQGRLVMYGFHGMIRTTTKGRLSALSYINLLIGYLRISRIHPFTLVTQNKSVIGCNLLHLFDEMDAAKVALAEGLMLLETKKVDAPPVTEIPFDDVARAHEILEHGKTTGKLVLKV